LRRAANVHCPDQVVWDFDPSRDNDLPGVVAGALALTAGCRLDRLHAA